MHSKTTTLLLSLRVLPIKVMREFVEQGSLFFILYIYFWDFRFHVRYLFSIIDVCCTPLGIFLNWYKLLKHKLLGPIILFKVAVSGP